MPAKPNTRNWNDVQTAIATAAIVTTLGLWNLFATPAASAAAQVKESTLPPAEPPLTSGSEPAQMPQVKILFTQTAPQIVSAQQQQPEIKKKKKNHAGTQTVTQTKSS